MPRFAVVFALALLWPAVLRGAEPGLVGDWKFDGSLEDRAGRSRDVLTAREGTARFVDAGEVLGVVGKAVALGVQPDDAQYLVAGASEDIRLAPNYTIEAWIHPTELSAWNRLVLRWGASPDYAYHLAVHQGQASLYHNPADGK